jgi:hypothetical protein
VLECRSDGLDPVLHSPTLHHSNKKGVWQADCRSKIKHPLAICLNAKVSSQQFPNFKRLELWNGWNELNGTFAGFEADNPDHSGSGMNSESPGTGAKRPPFQSAFACSIRSRELDTKFHQT